MTGITVCVPAYAPNKQFLGQLLESVRDQTQRPDAVVISEDPSPSQDVLRLTDLPKLNVPIQLEINQNRLGMAGNWNRSVELAKSDLTMVVGQDDLLWASAVEHHLTILRSVPSAAMSCSLPAYITEAAEPRASNQLSVSNFRLFERGATYVLGYEHLLELALCYGNVMGEPCGSCFRRRCWSDVGKFDIAYGHAVDLEFALRLAKSAGKIVLSTDHQSSRRLHRANATATHIRSGVTSSDRHRIFADYAADAPSGVRHRAAARLFTHDLFDAIRTQGDVRCRARKG